MTVHFIHSVAWRKMKNKLTADRSDLVTQLVNQRDHDNSMLLRGKITQIDEILERFPQMLGTDEDEDTD